MNGNNVAPAGLSGMPPFNANLPPPANDHQDGPMQEVEHQLQANVAPR